MLKCVHVIGCADWFGDLEVVDDGLFLCFGDSENK